MYDCLHLRFTLLPEAPGYAAFWESLALRQGHFTRQESTRWQLRFRGLRLDYWPQTGRGRIRGSLHTFFHGHNSGTFAAMEVPVAGQQLAAAFGLPTHVLQVEHLEVGVNLSLSTSPFGFLDSLLAHKGSRFYPQETPAGTTRPLLFVATHLDYRVKAYDKGTYNRVQGTILHHAPPHLLRFEVAYTRARPLQRLLRCADLTLEAIIQPAAVRQLAQTLRQHWHCIEHRFEPDFTGLSFSDMLLLHAATAPALWQAARHSVPTRTLGRYRGRSRRLLRCAEQSSHLAPFHQCFEQQLSNLLPIEDEVTAWVEMNSGDMSEHTSRPSQIKQGWPAFHPCNQVESAPLRLADASPIFHHTQPIPCNSSPGPVHATHYLTQAVILPASPEPLRPLLSAEISVATTRLQHIGQQPSPPYAPILIHPTPYIALCQVASPSYTIQRPETITTFSVTYLIRKYLHYRNLYTLIASKRIRPPPTP